MKPYIFLIVLLSFSVFAYAQCDVTDYLEEEATKTYTINGIDHEISVVRITPTEFQTIPDSESVLIKINGELEKKEEGDTFEHRPGIFVRIISIDSAVTMCIFDGVSDCDPVTVEDTSIIPYDGTDYSIEVVSIYSDTEITEKPRCVISLDGQESDEIEEGGSQTFQDGSVIEINTLLDDETKLGLVEFCLVAGIPLDECDTDEDCDLPDKEGICSGSPRRCSFEDPVIEVDELSDNSGEEVPVVNDSQEPCVDCGSIDEFVDETPDSCVDCENDSLDEKNSSGPCVDCEIDQCSANCDDGDSCTADSCQGTPMICENRKTQIGCNTENGCLPIGTRSATKYCGNDEKTHYLIDLGAICGEDYECTSDLCVDKICSKGVFKRFFHWLSKLFG